MIDFLERIGDAVGAWLYVIAGGLAFGEAAILLGMVLPGETALLVAGYFAHQGVLSLPIMIAVAIVGAVLGDTVGYEFGRHFGPALRGSRLGRWVGEPRWTRVDAFLHKYGGAAVLLGRFTAVLRALVPSMSGMARLPYLRVFLPWNALGGIVWGGGCVLLGYGFAASLDTVEKYATWAPIPIIVVVLAVAVVFEVRKRRREGAERTANAAAEDDRDPEPESESV